MHRMLTFFLLLSIACSSRAHGQNRSFPGHYISVQGDKVLGNFPDYAQWTRNPERVDFVDHASGSTLVLTPDNCKGFVVDGHDEYISFSGQRLINPIEDIEVIRDRAYSSLHDTLAYIKTFLRLITRTGGYELYAFSDNIRTNFFYRQAGGSFEELKYKMYFDQNQVREMAIYRQQLHNLFKDRIEKQNLERTLEKLVYREDRLKQFFEQLFPLPQTMQAPPKNAPGWVVAAGAVFNQIQVTGDRVYAPEFASYASSVAPLLSVGYLRPIDRSFGKYFILPQVKFYSYKVKGDYFDGTFTRATTYQADLVVTPELNGGMNVINRDQVQLFLSAGAGILLQKAAKEVQQSFAGTNGELYAQHESKLNNLSYVLNVSAGTILKKKFVLTGTYVFPSQLLNFIHYTPKLSGFQLRVGYKFNG